MFVGGKILEQCAPPALGPSPAGVTALKWLSGALHSCEDEPLQLKGTLTYSLLFAVKRGFVG